MRITACELQVTNGFSINREKAACRAIFRRHVGNRRAVSEREVIKPCAIEFNELVDHTFFTQHFGDGQNEVGRRRALFQLAGQFETDHFGDQHGYRLAQHRRFGFNTAHAPPQNGQTVHHSGVGVSAHQRIRIRDMAAAIFILLHPDSLGEIFKIHLMANACARRHHAEILECLLAPAQERITLAVAVEFNLDILLKGTLAAEGIDHHRVINHKIDSRQRIDFLRIAAQRLHRFAHRRQIDHGGNAGEILHQHACGAVCHFVFCFTLVGEPCLTGLHVIGRDRYAIFKTQQVFQQHLHRERQPRHITNMFRRFRQAEIVI